jgi:hypothetical protein
MDIVNNKNNAVLIYELRSTMVINMMNINNPINFPGCNNFKNDLELNNSVVSVLIV